MSSFNHRMIKNANLFYSHNSLFNNRDCAVPVDVTIDFDATFTKCTTDNCAGDNYHVIPTW